MAVGILGIRRFLVQIVQNTITNGRTDKIDSIYGSVAYVEGFSRDTVHLSDQLLTHYVLRDPWDVETGVAFTREKQINTTVFREVDQERRNEQTKIAANLVFIANYRRPLRCIGKPHTNGLLHK